MVPNTPLAPNTTPALLTWLRTHYPSVDLVHRIITQTPVRPNDVLNLNGSSVELLTGTLIFSVRKAMPLRTIPLTPELASLLTAYVQTSRPSR